MKINFFGDEQTIMNATFGICDDTDAAAKTPAYTDCTPANKDKWIAEVDNQTGKAIGFIAVDNKIEIRRANGDMENRCDAMLHNEDNIIFIELKDQEKHWISHAVQDQLATTVNIFKANHDIDCYRHKQAYACNRAHPQFAFSQKELMQRFYHEHGIRLLITSQITIKE